MTTTQKHLAIADITDNIILLKNGGGALVIQVSAVNFGLLSEREQLAIISAFAQMLNSLSFSIQILVFSERLNIDSYITLLDKAQKLQTNPLLSKLITNYKQFIQNTIKENDVLDKKFYLVIPLYNLELGLTPSKESLHQKIKTVLLPRRDQVTKQLSRVGLKVTQLNTSQLIELFFDIYNGQFVENMAPKPISPSEIQVKLKPPQVKLSPPTYQEQTVPPPTPQNPQQIISQPASPAGGQGGPSRTHPFVVEELDETI